ncbi:hypothetical protein HDU67_007112 [Dinochytrium kinnereticum]|nr:hypothetical protein HDU67_007112 [Dinochytrium kinnereticum]
MTAFKPLNLAIATLAIGIGISAAVALLRGMKGKRLRSNAVKDGICGLIGNTPVIRIKSLSDATGCDVYAKLEFLNIGGSLKDRLALQMMKEVEKSKGTTSKPMMIVEGTSSLEAYFDFGFNSDDQAAEKYAILEQLGAVVEIVRPVSFADPDHFVHVAKRRTEEMNAEGKVHAFYCNQFDNPLNFQAHFTSTGPEILQQMDGKLDAFVMGAGTGGTIAGISTFLKSKLPNLKVVLADPQGSGLFNKIKHGVMYSTTESEGKRKRHQVDSIVEGIGINRITRNFERAISNINDVVRVSDADALQMSRFLLQEEGLFVGSSSAVNAAASLKFAERLGPVSDATCDDD